MFQILTFSSSVEDRLQQARGTSDRYMELARVGCSDIGQANIKATAAATYETNGRRGLDSTEDSDGETVIQGPSGQTIIGAHQTVEQGPNGQTIIGDRLTIAQDTDGQTIIHVTQPTISTEPAETRSITSSLFSSSPTIDHSTSRAGSRSAVSSTITIDSTESTVITTYPASPSSGASEKSKSKGEIVGVFTGVGLAIAIASVFAIFVYRRIRASRTESRGASDPPAAIDIRTNRPRANGAIEPYRIDEFDRATWNEDAVTLRKFNTGDL